MVLSPQDLRKFSSPGKGSSKKPILRSERKKLKNGLTIVSENIPFFPSVTAGIWLKGGSRTEKESENGITHFIEHLLFKGTKELSYSQIYKTFDRMGGAIDAFTSRELMGFYLRVQKKNFEEAFNLLCEMVIHPAFKEEEIERERGVILEEINMVRDNPSEFAVDLFMENVYKGNTLSLPIQGKEKSVKQIKRRQIFQRHRDLISPSNIIITATGEITLREIEESFKKYLGDLHDQRRYRFQEARFQPGIKSYQKNHLEQTQIIIGFESEKASSEKRSILTVMANILGGTMSSRLFTEIREKLGIVYNISADQIGQFDTGIFAIQAASSNENAGKTLKEIIKVLYDFCENGASKEEIEIAKENLIGGTILSLESTSARMGRLARDEIYFGKPLPIENILNEIEKVKEDEILKCAREVFIPKRMNVTILGERKSLHGVDFSILDKKW